ncbi:MAG: tRNA (adenosine(37)-N6)-threonylcarbamoyltransferase complex dimerization subunit type 1 TsaB [Flavobacteriales bacterium]|nr:tRNA (adenosine(37)-N6)-threonylcarbamoyltransferase complex dimerization subunit type 1 TsaB [Flavobacteriales bacterium]
MPLILCIETATKLCSVALTRNGSVLASRDFESDKHVHAEKVNVFIDEVMKEAGLPLKELSAVAVGIGPGSYTGLRIGLSAAKGLCYALEIPVIGISTLHTLVAAARERGELTAVCLPMIDARRMEVFTQRYDAGGRAVGDVEAVVLDAAWAESNASATVFGDGAEKALELWKSSGLAVVEGVRPNASAMAGEAQRRFASGEFDDLAYLVPAYGKAANVTQPKKRMA